MNVNTGSVSVKLVEETLAEALSSICGASPERCVGIVADADRYSLNALEELEYRFPRMVNLCCQAQGISNLLKDFSNHLLLFRTVAAECTKIATFFNSQPQARSFLHKYQREVSTTPHTPPSHIPIPKFHYHNSSPHPRRSTTR